jgi:hypothetical protein
LKNFLGNFQLLGGGEGVTPNFREFFILQKNKIFDYWGITLSSPGRDIPAINLAKIQLILSFT